MTLEEHINELNKLQDEEAATIPEMEKDINSFILPSKQKYKITYEKFDVFHIYLMEQIEDDESKSVAELVFRGSYKEINAFISGMAERESFYDNYVLDSFPVDLRDMID